MFFVQSANYPLLFLFLPGECLLPQSSSFRVVRMCALVCVFVCLSLSLCVPLCFIMPTGKSMSGGLLTRVGHYWLHHWTIWPPCPRSPAHSFCGRSRSHSPFPSHDGMMVLSCSDYGGFCGFVGVTAMSRPENNPLSAFQLSHSPWPQCSLSVRGAICTSRCTQQSLVLSTPTSYKTLH